MEMRFHPPSVGSMISRALHRCYGKAADASGACLSGQRKGGAGLGQGDVIAAAANILELDLLSPTGRALAEDVWTRLILRQTVAVALERERAKARLLLPNVFPFTVPDRSARRRADSPFAASALAGLPVRTLQSPLLPHPPRFVIEQLTVQERVFDLAEAKADLKALGRAEPEWPAGIDGARIVLEPQGKSVISYYGNCPKLVGPWTSCAFVVQSPSMVLRLPGHLAPVADTRFSLELAGVPKDKAATLARLFGASPTLFIPLETKAEVRRVRVRGTEAMLITYPTDPSGETAYILDWHEEGFDFRIFGRDPRRAVAVAEALRAP